MNFNIFMIPNSNKITEMKLLLRESPENNNDGDNFHYHAVFPFVRGFKEERPCFQKSQFSLFSLKSLSELCLFRKGR